MNPSVACIVPCFNEEAAIGSVIAELKAALPEAVVYVYDNASTDGTAAAALAAGAVVRLEPQRGKGNVIRRAFADVDADAILLIDGDATYDASSAGRLVAELFAGPYDQVLGVRQVCSDGAYRPGHAAGNKLLTGAVRVLFGKDVTDMLSGYRVLSHRFVKSFPALSREFETETEMTVHALNLRLATKEVPTAFRDRGPGSESKLRTYRDGWRILRMILELARRERPALVHGVVSALLTLVALVLGVPVIGDYLRTGSVPRLPTAVLAAGIIIISALVALVGYVLESLRHVRQEQARIAYLNLRAPTCTDLVHDPGPGAVSATRAASQSETEPSTRQDEQRR